MRDKLGVILDRPSRNPDFYSLLFESSREIFPLLVHMICIVSKKTLPKVPLKFGKLK